jgi:transcriptional regulator with XRE-family HTH domain
MFAERLKALRTEKGLTQVELAVKLGVSKGTVGMWETGKRLPTFETVDEMTSIFDKRMDYILGYTDDASSPIPTDKEINQLALWLVEDDYTELVYKLLSLDNYGQKAVESLIKEELSRCKAQKTLVPRENFRVSIMAYCRPDEQDEDVEENQE